MTTYAAIVDSPEVAAARPILAEVARTIADVQVRNRGTIGGNVCSNDPTNHFPPLLAALGAEFTIRGADGERTVATDEFFEGVFATAVHPGELLTSIRIPAKGDARDGWASATLGKDGTGIVSVAATIADGNARHRDRLRRRDACRRSPPAPTRRRSTTPSRAPTSIRPATSMPPPTTAATSPRCSPPAL